VHSQVTRGAGATVWMTLTVEIDSSLRLDAVLSRLAAIPGVRRARRR